MRKSRAAIIKEVCKIAEEHYESGNQSKCYAAVWRNYVYPRYRIHYRTFLEYISVPASEINRILDEHKDTEPDNQLKLFED